MSYMRYIRPFFKRLLLQQNQNPKTQKRNFYKYSKRSNTKNKAYDKTNNQVNSISIFSKDNNTECDPILNCVTTENFRNYNAEASS